MIMHMLSRVKDMRSHYSGIWDETDLKQSCTDWTFSLLFSSHCIFMSGDWHVTHFNYLFSHLWMTRHSLFGERVDFLHSSKTFDIMIEGSLSVTVGLGWLFFYLKTTLNAGDGEEEFISVNLDKIFPKSYHLQKGKAHLPWSLWRELVQSKWVCLRSGGGVYAIGSYPCIQMAYGSSDAI